MNKDLTVGKPEKVLWAFCLPLFGSIIFQQLYNIADSLVAGKFIGENALAAVGNSYEITLIFIAFAFGCNIGCSVVVSRYFGAKLYADMKTAVHTTLIFSGAVCAVLMALGLIFQQPLLQLIKTPEDVLADSSLYLDIYIWGLPFVFFYNISEGIFSAMGDSKTPFIFLACSSLSNIAMDILFVTAFNMGVAGVAWATFLCQGISCLLALYFVLRRLAKIRIEDDRARLFSRRILGEIVRIALPSTLQQSFISVGNIVIQSVVNSFGASVMAGYSAAIKLNNLVITSFTTLGNGISNYTGQNLGADKPDRVRAGFKAGVRDGVAAVRAAGGAVSAVRRGADPILYERALRAGGGKRLAAAACGCALLLCGIGQAGSGRRPARGRDDARLYGKHADGSGAARGAGSVPVGRHGYAGCVERLAHRLVRGYGAVAAVLSAQVQKAAGRRLKILDRSNFRRLAG